jgi:hypothetical protein
MSSRLDSFLEPDISDLIERCVKRGDESDFSKFRSAWHPQLEAALALVSPNWSMAQKLYDQIYDEYFDTFKHPKKAFQSSRKLYMLAVAFSYLIQQRGDEPLQQLLTHMLGENRPSRMTQHEFYIVIFCAILRRPPQCVTPLLLSAFLPASDNWGLRQSSMLMYHAKALELVPNACVADLKSVLWRVLR